MTASRQQSQKASGNGYAAGCRILMANPTGILGGSEQVLLALAERLPAYGAKASFALLRPGPLEQILRSAGITVHVFDQDYRYRDLPSVLRCISWLTDCIKADGANLLHSNLTAHLVGAWAARRAGIPEVWHLHDYPYKFDPIYSLCRRLPGDFSLFTTEFVKSGERIAARRPNAVVNPNCIDIQKLKSIPADASVRNRFGIGAGKFFLTVARLQEHKGHRYLIEAASKLSTKYPNLKWVIVGAAKGEEQEAYRQNILKQIEESNLTGRVIMTGYVDAADMVPLLKEAAALVHPAVTEGYGLVLLEAMACGTPVIAASAAGPREIIESGNNGLLVRAKDALGIADAMQQLLDEPALAARLSANASVDVEAKNVDVMVEQTAHCYTKILASKQANRAPNLS